MKNGFLFLVILFFLVISILSNGCGPNDPPNPDFPTYSYLDSITYPPDVFEIVYNISYYGDRIAFVTFENDAVWIVEKLGDSRIYFGVQNDTAGHVIWGADTIGFKQDFTYYFIANNNNYDEFKNFFSHFTKLDIEYSEFEPKF